MTAEREAEVLREALTGVALAWAVASGGGSTDALGLIDREMERAEAVVSTREYARGTAGG